MKILSMIGTRPQYIKIKPLYEYFNKCGLRHIIVDTLQHYTDNVSKNIIDDLGLDIDYNVEVEKETEIQFISNTIGEINNILVKEKPDVVLVFGDTNSSFCAALTAYKLNIPVCHVEAGLRCGNKKVPEEINRIFIDNISSINFCSSKSSMNNLNNTAVHCGDLEYELLNSINPDIDFLNYGLMTIHRQSNCSADRIELIMKFCESLEQEIIFPAHHRILPFLKKIKIPKNIKVIEPLRYTEMVNSMSKANFILTDSGSIQKTSAFFGKKTLVFRKDIEWKETEEEGYSRRFSSLTEDKEWILDRLDKRNKFLYMPEGNPSEIIKKEILRWK